MTHLTNDIYAIEAPEGITDFRSFVKGVKNDELDIPEGEAKFLFVTLHATEEQASGIVEPIDCGYMTVYKSYNKAAGDFHWKALDSLRSLLAAKGLDGKNCVVVKRD